MKSAFILFLAFVGYQIVSACIASLLCKTGLVATGSLFEVQTYCLAVCGSLAVFLACRLGLLRSRPVWTRSLLAPARTALLGIGVLVAAWGLSLCLEPLHLNDGGTEPLFRSTIAHPLSLLVLVLIGPLLEEVFFRAGIARQLALSGNTPQVAAVLSALAFAVVHINPAQAVPAFILGYLLAVCYFTTGNLLLCTAIHILNNVVAVIALADPTVDAASTTDNAAESILMGIALIALAAVLVWSGIRVCSKQREAITQRLRNEKDDFIEDKDKEERSLEKL